jgi:hypothetical protein
VCGLRLPAPRGCLRCHVKLDGSPDVVLRGDGEPDLRRAEFIKCGLRAGGGEFGAVAIAAEVAEEKV